MSQRLTVGDLKDDTSRIAASLNVCPDDARFMSWLNKAEERMANQGRFFGSIQEVQFCIDYTGCFTIPREIASFERVAINGSNIAIENGWFAFTRQITSIPQCASCCSGCCKEHLKLRIKEGTQVSFNRTIGSNKVIRSYPTNAADVGKKIVYQGYDSNNIWVKTTNSAGVLIDGEEVVLALPFVDTNTVWYTGAPLGVTKEVTQYRVLVYEYDTVTGAEVDLADYQPGETRPSYRIGHLPNLASANPTNCSSGTVGRYTMTAMASLQHVPLVSDGDWLLFQNLGAYESAMIAMKAYEDRDVDLGNYYFYGTQSASRNGRGVMRVVNRGGAIPLLNAELRKNSSDRVNAFIYTEESNTLVKAMAGFR